MPHTLECYQLEAAESSHDVTMPAALSNLLTADAQIARLMLQSRQPVGESLEDWNAMAMAALGAALYNITIIADGFNLKLEDVAALQLQRLRTQSASGRLRRIAMTGRETVEL